MAHMLYRCKQPAVGSDDLNDSAEVAAESEPLSHDCKQYATDTSVNQDGSDGLNGSAESGSQNHYYKGSALDTSVNQDVLAETESQSSRCTCYKKSRRKQKI